MATASPRTDRWTAVILLAMAAIFPTGILGLYFFYQSNDWRHAAEVAMAPEHGARVQFVLLGIGAVLSWIAAAITTVARQRVVLRTLFFAASAVSVSYAVASMWPLALVSALPLWWCYKVSAS
jgi:Kef-type K+ transport system membrane component KefB